jgi:hypothetical protein
MMGVVESSWVSSNVGAGFAWQIIADLCFGSCNLVEISCIHHLLVHKVDLILLIEVAAAFSTVSGIDYVCFYFLIMVEN